MRTSGSRLNFTLGMALSAIGAIAFCLDGIWGVLGTAAAIAAGLGAGALLGRWIDKGTP